MDLAYHDQGFRILGVNLDALAEAAATSPRSSPSCAGSWSSTTSRWPNLISPPGEQSLARPFGVTDIPASVLVGRDGTVLHLDLTRSNLARVVARSVGQAGK